MLFVAVSVCFHHLLYAGKHAVLRPSLISFLTRYVQEQGGEAFLRVDRTPDSPKLKLAIVLRMILCLEAPVFSLFLGSGMCE